MNNCLKTLLAWVLSVLVPPGAAMIGMEAM